MKKTMKKLLCAVLAAATLGTCSMGVSAEESYLAGDVDMNGAVDADDAHKVLYEYLRVDVLGEEPEFTEEEFALANVYPDNLLDPNDACVILCYYLYTATLGGEPMTVTEFFERRLYLSEYGDSAKEG